MKINVNLVYFDKAVVLSLMCDCYKNGNKPNKGQLK